MTKGGSAPLDVPSQVGLPQSDNFPPAGAHVLVLGPVERHPLTYSRLSARSGTVMPIVAVKLDDQASGRDYSVGDELAGECPLREVVDPHRIQQRVSGNLGAGYVNGLLHGAHREYPCIDIRVGISTGNGAVGDVVVSAGGPGRRPAERAAAHLARVRRLVAPLVRVVAIVRAELRIGGAALGYVEVKSALGALERGPGSPLWPRGTSVAGKRAVLPPGWHPLSDDSAAGNARDGPDLVSLYTLCHKPSIQQRLTQRS